MKKKKLLNPFPACIQAYDCIRACWNTLCVYKVLPSSLLTKRVRNGSKQPETSCYSPPAGVKPVKFAILFYFRTEARQRALIQRYSRPVY
ncbi:hypothetical protein OUZ56_002995 [Daphnia magna]|uniref:Uncharacterized protein n=1 Tax=Daphnia magna TaxID=35525 RepID=A0ABR0A7G6_9CRUS|nr:hypothetical protein OUZ56_002995 [Daphnia magna]